jgi:hypothetical protein
VGCINSNRRNTLRVVRCVQYHHITTTAGSRIQLNCIIIGDGNDASDVGGVSDGFSFVHCCNGIGGSVGNATTTDNGDATESIFRDRRGPI